MKPFDPDTLLSDINRSILPRALALSFVVHVALIGLSSFGLYADWREYGILPPSKINALKKAAAEKTTEDAATPEATREQAPLPRDSATPPVKQESAPDSATEPEAALPSTRGLAPLSNEIPVAPELEPLPPKSGFTLGEDFEL